MKLLGHLAALNFTENVKNYAMPLCHTKR